MESQAYIKYLRTSSKKVKELAQAIVGQNPNSAIESLEQTGRKAAVILSQVVKSALSNATNNLKLNKDALRIKTIHVSKGPMFKRFRAVSRGMAHPIKRQTVHIKVVLEETKEGKALSVKR